MAPSVHPRSPSSRKLRERSESPVRGGSSAAYSRSPRKGSLSNEKMERPKSKHRDSSPRTRSPVRSKPSRRGESSVRETKFSGPSSPKHSKSFANKDSPISRSPSPRSKRPRQAQTDREVDRDMERERERVRERGNVKNGDAEKHKKRVIEKDVKNDIRPADESHRSLSRSPSPRTKRLKRVQAEREVAQDAKRGKERNNDSDRHKRKSNEGASIDRRPSDEGHSLSHSKHARSTSSSDLARRNHDRSESPVRRSGSASQERKHDARAGARQEARARNEEAARDSGDDSVAKMKAAEEALEAKQQKPSFELSGKLAEETNRVKGVTLLFTEPPDARKPDMRWRLYVFKGGEVLNEPLYIHRQSCYLFGRERRVADVPTDHPSCSKQHAVIQFKLAEKEGADGMMTKRVRPYVMDLGSTNGTFVNDNRIEPQRYYELIEKDTLKFGNSSREYVILHENSAE